MALTYTGTNGLFTHLGKLVKHYNQFKTDATHASTGLDADRLDILDTFQAADQDVPIEGLVNGFERWKAEYVNRRAELAEYAASRLRDQDSVLDEIGASTDDINDILQRLIETMDADSESVNESSVSVGSVTANSANEGGGTVLTTDVLDGVTSPGMLNNTLLPGRTAYDGLTTELAAPDQTFSLRVAADSFQDDLDEGSEEVLWEGGVADQQHGLEDDGSGVIATIQPVHAATADHLTNPDFEDGFTGGVPDNWDLVGGVGDTNVKSAGSANADHGSDALLLQGDATASSIEIKQDIAATAVVARKRYCVTARLKKDSATTGTLLIQFEGTGYTPGASEKISVSVSSLGTSYGLNHFFVTMPAIIPSDFKLVIRWSGGTPGASEKVYIDDLGVGAVNYGGGVGLVIVRDSGPLARNDRYTFNVTNTEGVFQAFFRRAFGTQLPSSGTPTIADSLAQ